MKYYLYHIPGKKIGVTCDIYNRVTEQQGYEDHEFEILEMSEDIDYISKREIELQKEHGYRVDQKLYKNLKPNKQMKINVTEQTTTFPCPVDQLKERLTDIPGMEWYTDHGTCVIDKDSTDWIMNNVKTSMYNDDRCYVYNKAFARYFSKRKQLTIPLEKEIIIEPQPHNKPSDIKNAEESCCGKCDHGYEMFDKIRDWAYTRDLYKDGDMKTQYVKLQEEAGELAKAILNKDEFETIDGIGDMVVVLTNLAHLAGTDIEFCIEEAYKEIASRKGKMMNGTFVKESTAEFIPPEQKAI